MFESIINSHEQIGLPEGDLLTLIDHKPPDSVGLTLIWL